MAESLILAGQIELLGAEGGVPSAIPACAGAVFLLAPDYDMGSPQPVTDILAAGLLDGERPVGRRSSNRTITLPIKITAPDRDTLAAAREVLLSLTDEDSWPLTWTRDGGSPVIFDCFRASAAQPANQLFEEQELVSRLTVSFPALPYGRSDQNESILLTTPSQSWDPPPAPVTIDQYTVASNFLTGDNTGFEASAGNWTGAGNAGTTRTTAQAHAGTGSLQMTSVAAGNMQAASCSAANITTQGLACNTGDTVTVRAWFRTAVSARSCNAGADFYDANGTFISTLRGSNITDSAAAWTQATATLTAPAGAAYARVNAQVVSTGAANEVHYADDAWIDRGPVYSAVRPSQWTVSTITPVAGTKSARWSRGAGDCLVYDDVVPGAALDITGRSKLTFWLGLATTSAQYGTWHKGTVHVAVTLYDGTGQPLTFSGKQACQASALPSQPHWQLFTLHIPQMTSGFDYTTVSRYVITAWNHSDPQTAAQVLQAGAYLAAVTAAPSSTGSPVNRGAWYQIPGIRGSARAPLSVQAQPGPSSFSTVATFTTPGSNAWTAPGGVTKVDKAECWGGGGGGAGADSGAGKSGGGGGGGEYSAEYSVPVTAGNSYPAVVGAAGTGGTGQNGGTNDATAGGDSYWSGASGPQVYGHGGSRGLRGNTSGGDGGWGSPNTAEYSGGRGYAANTDTGFNAGGGGGGSGGTNAYGRNATDRGGAPAVTGGGPGGWGGSSSAGRDGKVPSTGPGGGGGGGWNGTSTPGNGANGKAGQVRLTYGASGLLPLNSLLLHQPGRDAPPALSPLCPVGSGADIPNGATEYTVPAVGALNARLDGTYTAYLVASSWNTPANSRTVTLTIRQYPYTGGTAATATLTRTLVPSTDVTNGYTDMGAVTLPVNAMAAGQLSGYFTVAVTSTNTSDRFYDCLLLDVLGSTVLVNIPGTSVINNMWVDEPDPDRAMGLVLGSNADRDQAYALASSLERLSGEPLSVEPGINNRLLVYAAQGCPAATLQYTPRWWMDRAA